MSTTAMSKKTLPPTDEDQVKHDEDDSQDEDDEGLQEQIQIMKANRLKNANQICDQIYERQYNVLKKDYHSMRQRVGQ